MHFLSSLSSVSAADGRRGLNSWDSTLGNCYCGAASRRMCGGDEVLWWRGLILVVCVYMHHGWAEAALRVIALKHSCQSFSSSPIASLTLALIHTLSHVDTLSWQLSKTLTLTYSRTHTLLLSLHTASGQGGVYPGLALGQLIDRWSAFLNLDAKEWA